MEGTLASNLRLCAMGAIAAMHCARPDTRVIGFIGRCEQATMHLLAMKTVLPSRAECRVSAKTTNEERQFIDQLSPILPDMRHVAVQTRGEDAIQDADVIVTATRAQGPLLKAGWMKPGSFYSHIGGWEDEYAVAQQYEKIVCDDGETVKHRTQTLRRMYKEGALRDPDVYAHLDELVAGQKPVRRNDQERRYFNAVGLAFVDIAIALAMYQRAAKANLGQGLTLQETTIFEHAQIGPWLRR